MYKKLKKYAKDNKYNYDDLLSDFLNSSEDEQHSFLAQIGGEVQNPEAEIDQIISMYAQISGQPAEAIIQQLQSVPEEQQQQMLQQMVAAIQQTQQSSPEEQYQQGGIPMTTEGYYDLDPLENPYAMIPSGDITMQGIDFPINAYDGRTGEFLDTMQPNQDYQFDTDMVLEEPVYAQTAGYINIDPDFKNIITAIRSSTGNSSTGLSKITSKKDLTAFVSAYNKAFPNDKIKPSIISRVNDLQNDSSDVIANPSIGNESSFTGEFAKIKKDRDKNFQDFQKRNGVIKSQVEAVGKAMFNTTKALTQSQLATAYDSVKGYFNQSNQAPFDPKTKQGKENLDKIRQGISLDLPSPRGMASALDNVRNYFNEPTKPVFDLNSNSEQGRSNRSRVSDFFGNIFEALDRPAMGQGVGAVNPSTPQSTRPVTTAPAEVVNDQYKFSHSANGKNYYRDYEGNVWRKDGSDYTFIDKGSNTRTPSEEKQKQVNDKVNTSPRTRTNNPSGETVSDMFKKKTGLPWSEAKKRGLTDGSKEQNLLLFDKLKDPKFSLETTKNAEVVETKEPVTTNTVSFSTGRMSLVDAARNNVSFDSWAKSNKLDKIYWGEPRQPYNRNYNSLVDDLNHPQYHPSKTSTEIISKGQPINTPGTLEDLKPVSNRPAPNYNSSQSDLDMAYNSGAISPVEYDSYSQAPIAVPQEEAYTGLNFGNKFEELTHKIFRRKGDPTQVSQELFEEYKRGGLMEGEYRTLNNEWQKWASENKQKGGYAQVGVRGYNPSYMLDQAPNILDSSIIGVDRLNNNFSGLELITPNPGESFEEFRKRRALSGVSSNFNNVLDNPISTSSNASQTSESKEDSWLKQQWDKFKNRPKPIASISRRNDLVDSAIRQFNFARATRPTMPVSRGQSRVSYYNRPLLSLEPISNNIMAGLQQTLSRINPNSSEGKAVASNMYATAMDKLIQAGNQIAQENTRIEAENIAGAMNASNQQRQQQQQFDFAANDIQARRMAARDAGISQSLNDILAGRNAARERRMYLDMIDVLNPALTSKNFLGRKNFFQNPDYKLENVNIKTPK